MRAETKKPRDLQGALVFLGLSDAGFGDRCEPRIHRTLVRKYRKALKVPRSDTSQNMLSTLKRLGVELTLKELLTAPRNNGDRSKLRKSA